MFLLVIASDQYDNMLTCRNIRFTMEENRNWNLETKDSPDPIPPLIKYVSTHELECFDSLNKDTESDSHTISPSLVVSPYIIPSICVSPLCNEVVAVISFLFYILYWLWQLCG